MSEHIKWLESCPANDGNFKTHLPQATNKEIEQLLAELPERGNVTKLKVLRRELRRREKQGIKII